MGITAATVVSYSFSTSNHNRMLSFLHCVIVVSYSFSTSNHNGPGNEVARLELYLILFLHQTTTLRAASYTAATLYLILFLHQTTTHLVAQLDNVSCILFFFYIKPQPLWQTLLTRRRCILFFFYIKPQPPRRRSCPAPVVSYSFSTSNHNLRVSGDYLEVLYLILFLHQTTTNRQFSIFCIALYLILFLHQTTTLAF